MDVPIAGRRTISMTGTTPPATINTVRTENGVPVFTFLGEIGKTYVLECSTDLVNWTPVAVVTNSSGAISHVDNEALNQEKRYYRARLAP
jgi:hypothetical protein